jgi:hypothetical protein
VNCSIEFKASLVLEASTNVDPFFFLEASLKADPSIVIKASCKVENPANFLVP